MENISKTKLYENDDGTINHVIADKVDKCCVFSAYGRLRPKISRCIIPSFVLHKRDKSLHDVLVREKLRRLVLRNTKPH